MSEEKLTTTIWIFPAILVATLLQSYYDISEIFSGGDLAIYTYEGPIVYKIGKDIIYLWIFFSILIFSRKIHKTPFNVYLMAIIFLIAILCIVSALLNGYFMAVIGLRWVMPFILFLLMRDWATSINKKHAIQWLFYGMTICIGAQIYQLFNMPPVFGEIFPGISARTPGIFLAPNSTAFFACSSAAYVMVLNRTNRMLRLYSVLLAFAISVLAQSGTGIIVSVVLFVWLILSNRPVLFWVTSFFVVCMMFLNLNKITAREDYIELSGGGRLDALISVATASAMSLANFGIFTNTANIQSVNPEQEIAVDSLVAAWIGNFGVFAVPIFVLTLCFVMFRMKAVDWRIAMPSVIVFLMFSLTTIVFEAFPMNIYIAMGIWAAAITGAKSNQSFN